MGNCVSPSRFTRSNSNTASSALAGTAADGGDHQSEVRNVKRRWIKLKGYGERVDFGYARDFDKRYSIGHSLGVGRYGRVVAATDRSNGNRVAVKMLERKKMLLRVTVEDVKREVQILASLAGNENVVHFHNAFEDDSYVYIVMELCEGGLLLDRIMFQKHSRYSEKDATVIIRQILIIAAQCHLHGIVHRDIKPENFMFKSKEDSILKVIDFGLSDYIKPGKRFQDIVGSTYYLAPEVIKHDSGPESDVWSIGVITYILLFGRRPFWNSNEDDIMKEILNNEPDYQRKPWATLSGGGKDFVQKLLLKDPLARPTAAQALSHPWVREGGDASEIPLDISVLHNMRQYVTYSRLKRFSLRAYSSTFDEQEMTDLRDQFNAIDVDKDGFISHEELTQALGEDLSWKLEEVDLIQILQAIDGDMCGVVNFDTFVAAAMHVDQLAGHDSKKWLQRSQAAFDKFDRDRDGYVRPEDLLCLFATFTPGELRMHASIKDCIGPLLEEADIDRDGKISLLEFRKLLRTANISLRE